MTVFIFGTSNSILDGGYVPLLRESLSSRGIETRNYSCGDQTSVMGLMRLCDRLDEIGPGDVVIWEYPLLDILLSDAGWDPDLVVLSAINAWTRVIERRAVPLLLTIPPRESLKGGQPHPLMHALRVAARDLGVREIDASEAYAQIMPSPADWGDLYEDDRHLIERGSGFVAVARLVAVAVAGATGNSTVVPDQFAARLEALPRAWSRRLIWHSGHDLKGGARGGRPVPRTWSNRFLTVDAVTLDGDTCLALPPGERVVAAGMISTVNGGFLWCGHLGCPPVSCRLPDALSRFTFLLRATRVPCMRLQPPDALRSAPDWSLQGHVWADYGQSADKYPGAVDIVGVLCLDKLDQG